MDIAETYIIAEVGPNHNGDLDTARKMIRLLAKTGVNAVKFQLAVPENVYSKDAFKASYQKANDGPGSPIEMSRRVQLLPDDHRYLYADCKEEGVDYLCSAFDLESLQFLDNNFSLPYFKIASGEILSVDQLRYISTKTVPVLISTGMATFDDIQKSLAILDPKNNREITIMHCVSNYPTSLANINLRVMDNLARTFGRPVGYSDHSLGTACCLAAVARGARVVEKHVTIDRNSQGPDHKASATIDEIAELVDGIRSIERALGSDIKSVSNAELEISRMARKSIVSKHRISANSVISSDDLCFKRPGIGISPLDINNVIGKTAVEEIPADKVIHIDWLK